MANVEGGEVVTVTNGQPDAARAVAGSGELLGVACPAVASCVAVGTTNSAGGGQGLVVTITNGTPGRVWAVPGTAVLTRLACSSVALCVAVGTTADQGSGGHGATVTVADGMPGNARSVPATVSLVGVACASAAACVAVGYNNAASDTVGVLVAVNNGIPGSPRTVPGSGILTGVACPTAAFCEAVGDNRSGGVTVTITDGTPGNARAVPAGGHASPGVSGGELFAVVCPSASVCEAVGVSPDGGVVVPIVSGIPEVSAAVSGASGGLSDIACPAVDSCEAVGVASRLTGGVVVPVALSSVPVIPPARTSAPSTTLPATSTTLPTRACFSSDLVVNATTDRSRYPADQDVTVTITVKNPFPYRCSILTVPVVAFHDPSGAHISTATKRILGFTLLIDAGQVVTATFPPWDQKGCIQDSVRCAAGQKYTAEVSLTTTHKATVTFALV